MKINLKIFIAYFLAYYIQFEFIVFINHFDWYIYRDRVNKKMKRIWMKDFFVIIFILINNL